MNIHQLNQLDRAGFVARLGGVFEHSPWVAEAAFAERPFADRAALHAAMCAAVDSADTGAQLTLIRAHPQLAGKAAIADELTDASRGEQQGAGLDRCTPEQFARIRSLNDSYQQRFGFPFILAVRGHTRESIIAAMQTRIDNPPSEEFAEALRQIGRIAGFRLADLIQD